MCIDQKTEEMAAKSLGGFVHKGFPRYLYQSSMTFEHNDIIIFKNVEPLAVKRQFLISQDKICFCHWEFSPKQHDICT